MSITRAALAFRPTLKGASGTLNPLWMIPQVASILLLLCAFFRIATRFGAAAAILLVFIACQAVPDVAMIVQWIRGASMRSAPAEASQTSIILPYSFVILRTRHLNTVSQDWRRRHVYCTCKRKAVRCAASTRY
jgi:hypothetical protein